MSLYVTYLLFHRFVSYKTVPKDIIYHLIFSKDCEDHAALLCSLLLGFGLSAYVCVGTKAKGASHSWVMTISPEGEVIFWESLTAHR